MLDLAYDSVNRSAVRESCMYLYGVEACIASQVTSFEAIYGADPVSAPQQTKFSAVRLSFAEGPRD